MGWPDIYSICSSQFDGDKGSLLLDGGFFFIIAIKLIRDNWKSVIGNYPTSLIIEIWFDLQDMGSLGCPRYRSLGRMNWAPVLGLFQEPGRFTGSAYKSSFNPTSWAWGVGLRTYFIKPNQLPPSPWLRRAWARAVSLLKLSATSTWLLRAGLVRVLPPPNVLW